MRLDELIATGRGEGNDTEESYARLAARAPYDAPSTPSFIRLGRHPKAKDLIDTPWGTKASARNFPDPPSIMGIAGVFNLPVRTVVLASAESALGIPMFEDADPIAEAISLLPSGWHTLASHRMAHWHRTGALLVEAQRQEKQLAEVMAERDALRQRVAQLEKERGKRP